MEASSYIAAKSNDSLLTMREASQVLRVHPNSLRRWSDEGLLKSYRVGVREIVDSGIKTY